VTTERMDNLFGDLVQLKNENKTLVIKNSEITSSTLVIRENYKMMENIIVQKDKTIKSLIMERNDAKSDLVSVRNNYNELNNKIKN